jgi:hypothetical protein
LSVVQRKESLQQLARLFPQRLGSLELDGGCVDCAAAGSSFDRFAEPGDLQGADRPARPFESVRFSPEGLCVARAQRDPNALQAAWSRVEKRLNQLAGERIVVAADLVDSRKQGIRLEPIAQRRVVWIARHFVLHAMRQGESHYLAQFRYGEPGGMGAKSTKLPGWLEERES